MVFTPTERQTMNRILEMIYPLWVMLAGATLMVLAFAAAIAPGVESAPEDGGPLNRLGMFVIRALQEGFIGTHAISVILVLLYGVLMVVVSRHMMRRLPRAL